MKRKFSNSTEVLVVPLVGFTCGGAKHQFVKNNPEMSLQELVQPRSYSRQRTTSRTRRIFIEAPTEANRLHTLVTVVDGKGSRA
jgi:hypothetical protein